MSDTPESVLEQAAWHETHGRPVTAAMLRNYAALLRAEPAPSGCRVRPLKWRDRWRAGVDWCEVADGVELEWKVNGDGDKWEVWRGDDYIGKFPTLDAAKAAAQADFGARVRACLEPAPDPVREAAVVMIEAMDATLFPSPDERRVAIVRAWDNLRAALAHKETPDGK